MRRGKRLDAAALRAHFAIGTGNSAEAGYVELDTLSWTACAANWVTLTVLDQSENGRSRLTWPAI